MQDFWIVITAALATTLFNAIYFAFVKKDIDRRMEQFKIAYSGIFQEKIQLYRQLLTSMDELKEKIISYGHGGDDAFEDANDIKIEINKFIRLYEHGAMFYSRKIERICSEIRIEFQQVFESSFKYFYFKAIEGHNRDDLNDYISALSSLTQSEKYYQLKQELIQNVREEFGFND